MKMGMKAVDHSEHVRIAVVGIDSARQLGKNCCAQSRLKVSGKIAHNFSNHSQES